MIECCTNCKHYREIIKYKCVENGNFIANEEGYVCLEPADDGRVIHVINADPDKMHCVEWSRKSL